MKLRIFLIIFLSLFLFYFKVLAQSAGIEIRPAIFEEKANPGQSFSFILRATNLSSETKQFYLIRQDIKGLKPSGEPIFAEIGEESIYGLSQWIEIPSEPIIIDSGQTKEIGFSVKVPENASPGSHLGGIFLATEPEGRLKEVGTLVSYRVGSLINLRVSGEILEEGQIREFSVEKTIYYKGRPEVNFRTRVENLGNVLIRPRGPIDILNTFGKKITSLRLNDSAAAVFPKDIRQFEVSWRKEGLAFGRYQAIMSLIYGEEQKKTISATVSFWVLPLDVILPVCGGLLILILSAYLGLRIYIQKKIHQIYEATKAISGETTPVNGKKKEEEIIAIEKKSPPPKIVFVVISLLILIMIFLILMFFLLA